MFVTLFFCSVTDASLNFETLVCIANPIRQQVRLITMPKDYSGDTRSRALMFWTERFF